MSENKITSIAFAHVLLGDLRVKGAWDAGGDEDDGTLTIYGIKTFEQLSALLARFQDGQPVVFPQPGGNAAFDAAVAIKAPIETNGASPDQDVADLSIFGRLTQLKDIVAEIRRRGAADFAAVQEQIAALKDAEACPLLDRVANLDDRLRTCCAALQVPGAI